MKRTGLLLTGMLILTGCLAYAWQTLPHQQSELYMQEDFGAMQDEPEQAEQIVMRAEEYGYAYSMLPAEEQTLYLEIRDALINFEENVRLSSYDKDEISHAFQCVLNDHPEIFYVDGYTYTEYTLGDILRKITFTGTYRSSPEEIQQKQELIDSYVNRCLSGMPNDADDYTKVKYIYEYLIHHTEYDATVEDNQNICSVFIEGRSVCQGYAKATQYLLNEAGVFSTLVLGRVVGGEGHAWNLVRINGQYYYVDTTWGDASYQAVGGSTGYPNEKIPTINYDYLCVSTEQMNLTHELANVVELPECNSMDDNYYVREGFYFTQWDEEQIERIFREEYEKGSVYVTLKCDSYEVYSLMYAALITNQGIFKYLDCPDGLVSYSDDERQYSMSFWL
ncbi:MAG: hypothetical protein J1F42_03755 [Lachnospiraceae bacterium]|nr:hypothetical protein [Lachnospiraceae bacterium]